MGSPHNNSLVATENYEQKGDRLIRNLWQIVKDSIHNTHFVNHDTLSHRKKPLNKYFIQKRKIRRISIWSIDSRNIINYIPSSFWWIVSSAWRRRPRLNTQPAASQRNGSRPTQGSTAKLRLGWPPPCSE